MNCTASDAVVPTPGLPSERFELHMDAGSLDSEPHQAPTTATIKDNGPMNQSRALENNTAPGDRRILMCEAEIQALRGHVCQMQVTLTSTTRDLAQQNAALQQLQTHKKEQQDRFAGPVKSPNNAEPMSLEEEVEIGILQARVDGMEKERAEAGAVLKVLRKQREDTKSQLTHADTVIERQEHRIRRLEASVHRKGEQVEDFAVSIMKADDYARQQAGLIEDLKRQLSRSKCGPTRRRPTIDGSVRDAYVARKLGNIARSKDESPRRTPILRKLSMKRLRVVGRSPSV